MTADVIAPPSPCTKRAPISMASVCAAPHSREASVKTVRPTRKTCLRPTRSPIWPARRKHAAEGDEVGVDHPGEARLREAEVGLDRGQRDVHDRLVEDDHQHP